ncbi:MAG: dihydrofolate reductase family protein [Alphaproteobacteria bacterium]|nr:dihydrofolate reductase family protein [Alphaproteobacteria bacterium]
MTQVRLYTAASLDGFVADSEGDSEWMAPYRESMFVESGFLESIGAVIIGRRTFEMMQAFGDWPYDDKFAFILTSTAPRDLPQNAFFLSSGIAAAVQAAREKTSKDIWVVGGAVTMESALEAELIDIVEICVVPSLIGSGLSMLNRLKRKQKLEFEGIQAFSDGMVKLRYETVK